MRCPKCGEKRIKADWYVEQNATYHASYKGDTKVFYDWDYHDEQSSQPYVIDQDVELECLECNHEGDAKDFITEHTNPLYLMKFVDRLMFREWTLIKDESTNSDLLMQAEYLSMVLKSRGHDPQKLLEWPPT